MVKSERCERRGFDPWVGKIPGGGHGNPLQYPCLNPMTEEPGGLRPMGSERDTAERLSTQIDGEQDDGRMWLIQGLSWMVVGQDVKRDLPS